FGVRRNHPRSVADQESEAENKRKDCRESQAGGCWAHDFASRPSAGSRCHAGAVAVAYHDPRLGRQEFGALRLFRNRLRPPVFWLEQIAILADWKLPLHPGAGTRVV